MEKDIPRRLGWVHLTWNEAGSWLQTDHTGDKLLPNVLCSTGGTKSKSVITGITVESFVFKKCLYL